MTWIKGCHNDNCVEVLPTDDVVWVRDSRDPDNLWLTFTRQEWTAFIEAAKEGKFDL